MLNKLKKEVYRANMFLYKHGLAKLTWGNASAVCREKGYVVIKPSGVSYKKMTPDSMVIVSLRDGAIIESGCNFKPSSDTPTHLELYRRFENIGGVVHTHSRWATVYSQACKEIPPFGTTHADHFYGAIPCTRLLTPEEIKGDYELETGKLIAETCKTPDEIPAVLVACHAPFTWGTDAMDAAKNSLILEEVAFMAWQNSHQRANLPRIPKELLDKHYLRKHGENAYYGQ